MEMCPNEINWDDLLGSRLESAALILVSEVELTTTFSNRLSGWIVQGRSSVLAGSRDTSSEPYHPYNFDKVIYMMTCSFCSGGGGGGSVDVVSVVFVTLEGTSADALKAMALLLS
ncbi:hypothetical protein Tco_0940724 [Tanacetum coccineum]|uniref:Uncharacterized protein n=1 Tax=Tanacetum coccineum TaxID=301880 RepID=A0ABQ5DUW2_9ASTR